MPGGKVVGRRNQTDVVAGEGARGRVLSGVSSASRTSVRSTLVSVAENETVRTQRALSAVVANPEQMVTGLSTEPMVH